MTPYQARTLAMLQMKEHNRKQVLRFITALRKRFRREYGYEAQVTDKDLHHIVFANEPRRSLEALHEASMDYCWNNVPPHYPVPAPAIKTEYTFGFGLADGIFVTNNDWIVAGAFKDGLPLEPMEYTY